MKLSESDLELYRSMTSRRARQTDDCLGEDLLMKAASNDLNDAQRAGVVAHLGRCSDCAREYRIARSFRDVQSERNVVAAAFVSRWWGVAAAAVIALILPALIWLVAERQKGARTLRELEQRVESQSQELESARRRPAPVTTENTNVIAALIRPQFGVPIIDLDADNNREASTKVPAIIVPPTSDVFTLILHLNHVPRGPLDVELAGVSGAVVWRDHFAPDAQSSSITVALNRRAVPAGAYSIDVRSAVRRSTFRFRVEYR